jgi:fructose PTS system EIIBC or EIIC component
MYLKNIKQSLLYLQRHAMTGISYMGPLFTTASLVKISSTMLISRGFMDAGMYLSEFAEILFSLILPIFSMFIAYSIADKPGLIPGLALGWISSNPIANSSDSGFFGTLILAFLVGFLVKYMAEKIIFKELYNSVVPTFIIPLVTVILLLPIHIFFIAPIFGSYNQWIIRLVVQWGIIGQIIYAIITAAAIAADLGGPINKTAILFGTPLSAKFIMPMTAINLAIVIPPVGIGLSTMIDKLFRKKGIYDEDMREMGKEAFKLGLIAISEGGLPFLYEKPKGTFIVNVVGSVTGAVIAVSLGAVYWYPIPAVWGWILVENFSAYIIGLTVGVVITAVGNVIIRLKD